MTDDALAGLAGDAGLLAEWEDAGGIARTVSPDILHAALTALDLPSANAGDIAESRARLASSEQGRLLVVDVGTPVSVCGQLTLEDGRIRNIALGETIVEIGYHRIETDDRSVDIAVAPPRAPGVRDLTGRDRVWGTAAQIYSLRGDTPSGFGDFAALAQFARTAAGRGADALAISPVHAPFLADPRRFSPYSPSSRDALNPLFADPGMGEEPDGGMLIDWPVASPARIARLRAAFDGFPGDPAFDAFAAAGGDMLHGHALFEALHGHFHARGLQGGWQRWPVAYHDPASASVAAFSSEHTEEIRFHLFVQWLADRGLANAQKTARAGGMAIGLIADLAVGLDPGGSHAWARPDELLRGLTLGAPPDAFQAAGQGWGITGFSPAALKRLGYAPFLRTVRATLAHAGGIRVDHALGLGRLWVIPAGASPLDGVYLRQPMDDLLRLLALEAHRARAIAIGEDLGVVPPRFRDALERRHLLGMRVLPFERDKAGGFTNPADWTATAAAFTSTHDLTPIAGWWRGIDIAWRHALGGDGDTPRRRDEDRRRFWDRAETSVGADGGPPAADSPSRAVDAAIDLVARAPCELAIVPAEDLFGLEEAPNLPGTIDEHPNWRRRMPATADMAFARLEVLARTATLSRERPK